MSLHSSTAPSAHARYARKSATTPDAFGPRLRALRVVRGLSQRALAAQAGVSHTALGSWETGAHLPRIPELLAVLEALKATSAERRRLVTLVDAPRALHHIRQEAPPGLIALVGEAPGGGDLLRALRLRRGLTQDAAAAAIGVSQGRLARWEHSENWPDEERLRALCRALGAGAEEEAALVAGGARLGVAGVDDAGLDPEAWWDRLEDAWQRADGLPDLLFLAMEARLWQASAGDARARPLLMAAYATHARFLADVNRSSEAPPYADRALALLRAGYSTDCGLSRGVGEQWAWAAIAAVTLRGPAAWLAGEPTPVTAAARRRGRSAAEFLELWGEYARRSDSRAWMRAEAGFALAHAGDAEAAARCLEDACAIAATAENPFEVHNRRRDQAVVLARLARFGAALDALEASRPLTTLHPASAVQHKALEAECLLGLGRRSEAHDRAAEALAGCESPRMDRLRPHVAALADRL